MDIGRTVDDFARAFEALGRELARIPPMVPPLRARPLAAIQLDIDRATVPALRPAEV